MADIETVPIETVQIDTVLLEIRRVVREELAIEAPCSAETGLFTDLQLDSVGVLTLVVGLEDHFQIALADSDTAGVQTAGDLARLVAARAQVRGC